MVDSRAAELRKQIRTARGDEKAEAIRVLQHMGVLKHRHEWNMGFDEPFIGPKTRGHPLDGKKPR